MQQLLRVCLCLHSLRVSCSLDAYSLRKYDPEEGQSKSYDFVVDMLERDMPACLSKIDPVLTNRCSRGGTTPLWHHTSCTTPLLHHTTVTPITPHHSHPY